MALSTEKKVGIFFLAALILLGTVIEFVEGWSPFEKKDPYHAFFKTAVGIRSGDPVRLSGVEVGKIVSITIADNRVRLDFTVQAGTTIREDSQAEIQQTNFLGGHFLGISFGTPESPLLTPGSTVASREATSINQLISNLNRNQEKVLGELGNLLQESRTTFSDSIKRLNTIVTKIDTGEGTLGKLINDPQLYEELHGSLTGINKVMGRLLNGEGTLGRLLDDPALYDDAKKTFANFRDISDKMAKGKGTIGRLLGDEKLARQTMETFESLAAFTKKLNSSEGTLGKLMNDPQLYDDARIAMERVKNITGKIDQGEGTLGKLLNDDSLYSDAKTTLKKVEKTVDGLSDTGPMSALGVVVGTLF
ncbi:MAG: MCE family protein [Deltaproteobacteria bacterium]|nr:MCE family protein [Deltaproteobacteria bacterium]